MKEHRQMYLMLFLAYAIFAVLLCYPQQIAPSKIPSFFSMLGAGFIGSIIAVVLRSRKTKLPLSRLIPAAVVVLVCVAQFWGSFHWVGPVTGQESEIFRFYLITVLVNMAACAVGFFLK